MTVSTFLLDKTLSLSFCTRALVYLYFLHSQVFLHLHLDRFSFPQCSQTQWLSGGHHQRALMAHSGTGWPGDEAKSSTKWWWQMLRWKWWSFFQERSTTLLCLPSVKMAARATVWRHMFSQVSIGYSIYLPLRFHFIEHSFVYIYKHKMCDVSKVNNSLNLIVSLKSMN